MIAGGIVAMLMFQVFVNVGMTIGIMPITGVPLPLISYGGSSVLADVPGIGAPAVDIRAGAHGGGQKGRALGPHKEFEKSEEASFGQRRPRGDPRRADGRCLGTPAGPASLDASISATRVSPRSTLTNTCFFTCLFL